MTANATYHQPDTLDEALELLATGELCIAAGCTDLFPATERKSLPGPVLDITRIDALRGVRHGPNGVTIGATATWSDIIAADLPPAFDGLKLAAREVGARQVQSRGTIAGNLCNASPAADGVPPLLTLDAKVELASQNGLRMLPLSQFIIGPRKTALARGEVLTSIHVPMEASEGSANFLKLGARKYLVISIAMTAARIVSIDGIVQSAALAIGACSPVATRLSAAEAALIGAPLDPMRITEKMVAPALSPIDDMRADAGYRSQTALTLLRRTLAPLTNRRAA